MPTFNPELDYLLTRLDRLGSRGKLPAAPKGAFPGVPRKRAAALAALIDAATG